MPLLIPFGLDSYHRTHVLRLLPSWCCHFLMPAYPIDPRFVGLQLTGGMGCWNVVGKVCRYCIPRFPILPLLTPACFIHLHLVLQPLYFLLLFPDTYPVYCLFMVLAPLASGPCGLLPCSCSDRCVHRYRCYYVPMGHHARIFTLFTVDCTCRTCSLRISTPYRLPGS